MNRVLFLALALATLSPAALADDHNWLTASGVWADPANWDTGVPTSSDIALVNNGGTVTIDANASALSLSIGSLSTVQHNAGSVVIGPNASLIVNPTGHYVLNDGTLNARTFLFGGSFTLSGGTFAPETTYVGFDGTASFAQTGGTYKSSGVMFVGNGGVGTATQNGGIANRFALRIGSDGGTGFYGHSDGTQTISNDLSVLNGGYSLLGGVLTTKVTELFGTSTFIQSGGSHTTSSLRANDTSTYTYGGGTLVTPEIIASGGTFHQTGGDLSVDALTVMNGGTHRMSGGTVNIAKAWSVDGTADFTAASPVTVNVSTPGGLPATVNLTHASFVSPLNANINIGGVDTFVALPQGITPTSFGTFTNEGTTYTAGSTLVVDAGKTVHLTGNFNDRVQVSGTLTASAGQQLTLHGGIDVNGGGVVNLNNGIIFVNNGSASFSGGSVRAGSMQVTQASNVSQTGGSITITSGSALVDDGAVYQQSSGTMNASLLVGLNTGNGQYVMSGDAVLNADSVNVYSNVSSPSLRARTAADAPAAQFQHTGGLVNTSGVFVHPNAEYQMTNGTLAIDTNLTVDANATLDYSTGGELLIDPDATVNVSGNLIGPPGGTMAARNFGGSGTISTDVTADGVVSPGNSPGKLTVVGDFTLKSSSTVLMELAPNAHDELVVSGNAALAGVMQIKALGGKIPLPGEQYRLISFGSHTGDLSVVNRTGYGLLFDKHYAADGLTIQIGALGGDANLDGRTDLSDFTMLASNFNRTGRNWLGGDFTGEGVVDLTDFTILAAHFNQSLPADSLGTTVPEPASAGLLLAGLMLRRKRGQ